MTDDGRVDEQVERLGREHHQGGQRQRGDATAGGGRSRRLAYSDRVVAYQRRSSDCCSAARAEPSSPAPVARRRRLPVTPGVALCAAGAAGASATGDMGAVVGVCQVGRAPVARGAVTTAVAMVGSFQFA
ncbi:hypothetical protein GCM10009682_19130 [Luedemannella flava]|uniref:Uncharacterized protein n=1 Tax=Luedemannella flava TaxID=349316 RepID=A0ABN2LRN0_9ACTN